MAVNTSSWSNTVPSGNSSIRHGDDEIRSVKSTVQNLVNSEHYFNTDSASSASGGVHRPGSARVFFGTRASLATPSSADSAGRLYFSTDLESLHFLNASSASTIIGGRQPMGAYGNEIFTGGGAPANFASGSTTSVNFNTFTYDVGSFFAVGAPSRISLGSAGSGRYMLVANAQFFESVHTGSVRRIAIRRNGEVVLTEASAGTLVAGPISLSCSAMDFSSSTTWYYEMLLFHDTGVSLTSSQVSCNAAIHKLS